MSDGTGGIGQEALAKLDAAISEWHEVRPGLVGEDEERLWRKLRLEWNYHSNHIEGNTLTYDETVLLLLHGQTAGSHPLRDYEEMKAHDVAIELVRSLAGAEQPLAEADIRELNRVLLKEPFWKRAETPDGTPTRKRIIPGEYKQHPNHVRTPSGELHRFAEPEATPALMNEWVRRFRTDLDRDDYPLPTLLAESHASFVQIHPFDDGNGRTARLLTNYALLRKRLLPIVIRSRDRDRYIGALRRADAGNGVPLAEFMLTQLLWSLRLGVRAARGEPIQDPGDLDKEISLFVREKDPETATKSDVEILDAVYELYVRPMVERLDRHMEAFAKLFRVYRAEARIDAHAHKASGGDILAPAPWTAFREKIEAEPQCTLGDSPVWLRRVYTLEDYCGDAADTFSLLLRLKWVVGRDVRSFAASLNGRTIEEASHGIPYASLAESPDARKRVAGDVPLAARSG